MVCILNVCTEATAKTAELDSIQAVVRLDTMIALPIPYSYNVDYTRLCASDDTHFVVPFVTDGRNAFLRIRVADATWDTVYVDTTSSYQVNVEEVSTPATSCALRDSLLVITTGSIVRIYSIANNVMREFSRIQLRAKPTEVHVLDDSLIVLARIAYQQTTGDSYTMRSPETAAWIAHVRTGSVTEFELPPSAANVFSLLDPHRFLAVGAGRIWFLDPSIGAVYCKTPLGGWERCIDGPPDRSGWNPARLFADSMMHMLERPSMRYTANRLLELSADLQAAWSEYIIVDDQRSAVLVADRVSGSSPHGNNRWRFLSISDSNMSPKSYYDRGFEANIPCSKHTYPFLGVLQGTRLVNDWFVSVSLRGPIEIAYQEGARLSELYEREGAYMLSAEPFMMLCRYRYTP